MSFEFTKKQFEIHLNITKKEMDNLLINNRKSFINFYFSIKKLNYSVIWNNKIAESYFNKIELNNIK